LTKSHIEKRYKCAKEHLGKSLEDWKKVGWSEECSVEKSVDPCQVWVFWTVGEDQKYLPHNMQPKDKSGAVSLMVWGCFISLQIGPLVSFHGVNKATTYIAALEENLLPFLETLSPEVKQDNAAIHTACITKEWFRKQAFSLMEWPPNSPNMNPIEHLWRALKAKLHAKYPDTKTLAGGPERVRTQLEEQLKDVWMEIGEETLRELIESMPRRIQALYDAEEWYTKY
jgi:transposase